MNVFASKIRALRIDILIKNFKHKHKETSVCFLQLQKHTHSNFDKIVLLKSLKNCKICNKGNLR